MPLTRTPTTTVTSIDDVLSLAQDLIDADQQDLMTSAAGNTVACRARCTVCCHQAVPVGPAELRSIRDAIAEMEEPTRNAVERRIEGAAAELRSLGFTRTSLSDVASTQREDVAQSYFANRVMCPLLEDGVCSVRDARPMACREYLVSSDPSKCSSLEDPTVVRIRLRRDVLDNYTKFEAGHGDNGSLILALGLADQIPASLPVADQSQTGIFRQLTAM